MSLQLNGPLEKLLSGSMLTSFSVYWSDNTRKQEVRKAKSGYAFFVFPAH